MQTASAKFQVGTRSRQCRVKLLKHCLILAWILGLQSFQIHQFPSNRRKTANGWRVYRVPVWSERMKRPQEELRGFIYARMNLHNHLLSGCEKRVQEISPTGIPTNSLSKVWRMSFKRGCRSSCAGRLWLRMYAKNVW